MRDEENQNQGLRGRILRFPAERSMGLLYLRPMDQLRPNAWEYFGVARGNVPVPARMEVRLRVSDEASTDLSPLGSLGPKDLQRLYLAGTQVSDAGLVHLRHLTALQYLDLWDTQVGDAGLAHLRGLTGLQELCLGHTQVSDAGLVHLRGLTGLQELCLGGTQVSDAGGTC